ncbi:MAG: helix-turn-helix transcriptional regulator [Nakamurella sp.]
MDITEVLAPVRDLGGFIRQQRESAQISLRQLAKRAGVSNPYLSQVERGLRRPSAEILAQIAHGLQISVESLLTLAGILEEPAGDAARAVRPLGPVGVDAAITADPVLSDRQKASLREIYLLYRRENEHDREPGAPRTTLSGAPASVTPAATPAPTGVLTADEGGADPRVAPPTPDPVSDPTPPPVPPRGADHEGDSHVFPH